MVKVLPEPVTPSSTWLASPRLKALDQGLDGLRLVAPPGAYSDCSLKARSLGNASGPSAFGGAVC